MTPLLLTVLSACACAIIIWRAEPALNRMSPATPLPVRMAMWLLLVGAAAQLLAITLGATTPWPTVVLELGVASLLYCERRLHLLIPRSRPPQHRPSPGR